MCILDAISCDSDSDCHMNSTGLSPPPILHADARIGERTDCQYACTVDHTGSLSTDITSSLLFARQPAISATNEPFESPGNPIEIYQPPPHVVDYWFDQLGLSLDPASPENPSNATNSSLQFPLFDSTTYVGYFGFVYVLRGVLIGFHYISSPLEPQLLRQDPLKFLWFPMLNLKGPLRLSLPPQIKSSIGRRNPVE